MSHKFSLLGSCLVLAERRRDKLFLAVEIGNWNSFSTGTATWGDSSGGLEINSDKDKSLEIAASSC